MRPPPRLLRLTAALPPVDLQAALTAAEAARIAERLRAFDIEEVGIQDNTSDGTGQQHPRGCLTRSSDRPPPHLALPVPLPPAGWDACVVRTA